MMPTFIEDGYQEQAKRKVRTQKQSKSKDSLARLTKHKPDFSFANQ
jgi:hypothetical protein